MTFPSLRPFVCLAILWAIAGPPAAAAPARARDVLVLDAGKQSTAIVLAEGATSVAQFAALELQWHLEKITGEKPPIVREPDVPAAPVKIAVGATALGKRLGFPVDQLQPWEFLVAEKGGTVVLAGGDDPATEKADWNSLGLVFNSKPNGTCRAVSEFLEECCGVHWYLPSEAGMVFPQAKRLSVRMGAPIRRRSDFRSTSFYPYQVNGKMFCPPDTPELAGDNVPDSDQEKWRRNLWTIPITTKDMLTVVEVQRWLLRNKVGGEAYGPNHSFGNWIERFGREHPDWFSYKDKARVEEVLALGGAKTFNRFHETGEPCLTAPGVYEQAVADARDYLDRRAGKGDPARKDVAYQGSGGRFFGIVPNDNYVWCQCPTCWPLYNKPAVDCPLWGGATGSASFYLWDFANRVARDIRKTHPDGWVGGIAYHDYMAPPKDFTLEPNVAVTICTYLGNWTPALRDTAHGLVKAWRDDAKCQWIGMWEYYCYSAMSQYAPMFPRVCPRLLGEDVKKLHKMGVLAEFIESEDYYRFKDAPDRGWAVWTNPIWLYLNVWTRFKMFDDTGRDVDKLLADHYRLFYGPAEKPVRRFFERIEERITDNSLRGAKTFTDNGSDRQMADFEYLFPPDVMKELRGYADEATRLAASEPFKTRVTWVREGFLEPQEKRLVRYLEQRKKTAANRPAEGICYRLKEAPAIDGAGDDAAWKGQPAYTLGDWRTGAQPKAPTTFRMGHDDAFLYLLVRCDDPDAKKIRAACKERDGAVYQDDCIEVHLSPAREGQYRYQILVNTLGVVQDFRHSVNEAGADVPSLTWNCEGLVTQAKVDDKGYTVEMKIPLAQVGGAPKPGGSLYGNICREKYTLSDGNGPDGLQAWSATQGAFADARYFGRMLFVPEEGWALFAQPEAAPPAPVLYKVDAQNPWTIAPDTIRASLDRGGFHYAMNCPKVDDKGRTYAGFGAKVDPPVDVTQFPNLEVVFRKPNRDVMLEIIYNYEGADGKPASNYFILSRFGEENAAPQVFSAPLAQGHERDRPAPRLLKSITVYAVVEGGKTPLECDFTVQWIRVGKETLRGVQP